MSTQTDMMREILEGRNTNGQDPKKVFTKIVAALPPHEVTQALREVTSDIHPPVLDHLLIEVLHQRIKTDDHLITTIQNDLLNQGSDTEFWLVLLRVFDGFLRKKNGYQSKRQQFLENLAAVAARPVRLRASAIRRFNLKPGKSSMKKLDPFLKSSEPWLLNAAAHIVAHWQSTGAPVDESDLKPIFAFSRQNPNLVIKLPAVLRILAESKDPGAKQILDHLSETADGEDRARLINVVGGKLSPKQLADLIKSITQEWDMQSEQVLQNLLIHEPKRLEEIYQQGGERVYLYGLSLLPDTMKSNAIKPLEDVWENSSVISGEAERVFRDIEMFGPRSKIRKARRLSSREDIIRHLETSQRRASELFRVDPAKVADGFNTGFHKADALYIDLGPGFNIAGQHWHSGLYMGFIPTRSGRVGTLRVVQAGQSGSQSNNFFDFDCIEIVPSSLTFESPEVSVADTMRTLRNNLVLGLQDSDTNRLFHGARRTPGMTAELAEKIVATGVSFLDQGIDYTALDMMNQKGWSWNGTVQDIEATRCDGLVEFSYEEHNQIVCRGLDEARKNIAQRPLSKLTNHNDLHLDSLDPGELCPRVQAGDQGDAAHLGTLNSRMTTAEGPTLPEVESFYVTPRFSILPPIINFRVKAQRYNHVYIRLTVRKDEEPFKFVHTDSIGTQASPDANWRFELVHTDLDMAAFWLGRTADGTDYRNQDGKYEFQLVAVDLAGNVSELRRATVDIQWAGSP